MSTNAYESPFSSRYASEEMQYVFSQDNKFKTWRKLWIALAKAEKALGINSNPCATYHGKGRTADR